MKKSAIFLIFCLLAACHSSSDSSEKPDNKAATAEKEVFSTTELSMPGTGISFEISISETELTIQPKGLEIINDALRHDITGYSVTNAVTEDLNSDGWPEVLVFLNSHGSGSYGRLIAYSVNNGKSVSQVHMPELSESAGLAKGYMGHDKMSVANCRLRRVYPVYNEGDSNAEPTGGIRQIEYELIDGESGRLFKVCKVEEK